MINIVNLFHLNAYARISGLRDYIFDFLFVYTKEVGIHVARTIKCNKVTKWYFCHGNRQTLTIVCVDVIITRLHSANVVVFYQL
jgi:hypothetical protein